MNELRIYWKDSVLYSNLTNYFSIGYIDNTGKIYNITLTPSVFLKITIIEPVNTALPKDVLINDIPYKTISVSPSDTNITLAIKLDYIPSGISQVFSFTLVPQINLLSQNDIQLLISRVLPPDVYNVGVSSTVYPRLYGIANTLISLYQPTTNNEVKNISNFISDIYPINGNPNWELTLDGTQSLLYQSSQQQYGQLLQHIYATTINNDNNPYYYAYNISKFIALLLFNPNNTSDTPSQYYVALDENKANINKSFIIANNSLDNVILSATNNELQLNINIFSINFDPNPSLYNNKWQKNIINQYIRRITRCAVSPIINYGPPPMLRISSYLDNTYWGDPRQAGTYCIAYNPGILEQAIGYVLPIITLSEVVGVTFQISGDGISWTDFTTPDIPVTVDVIYRLRATISPSTLDIDGSPYGQFYIGNNGKVTDIKVNYNPNPTTQPTNNNYFTIVFNITGIVSINAYGLWFNQVGTFDVTGIIPTTNANFTPSATSGNVPFSVTFTNTTNGIPNVGFAWNWQVSGGTQGTDWSFTTGSSTSQDVVILFNTALASGTTYNVTLNASLDGVTYTPKNVAITANPASAVQADFSFLPLLPTTIDTVVFTDTTPAPLPTNYVWSILPATGWNFVTPTSPSSKNPSIQFTIVNTYQVTNAPTGSVTYTAKTKPVTVSLAPPNPTVALTSPSTTTNVSITTPIILTFSEAVNGVSTTNISFEISGSQPQTITITTTDNINYTLGYTGSLTNSTEYIVRVGLGITSVALPIRSVASTQFTFTTISSNPNNAFIMDNNSLGTVILEEAQVDLLPVTSVTFQISGDGISWTDFTTPNIPVNERVTYKLRATALPSTLNINGSLYGQFYIGNNGKVTDIKVNYNPNAIDNNSYFTIVFNITGSISVNAYGLWFNQVGTFIVT